MRVLSIPFGPSFLYSIFLRFGTTSARSGGGGARPGGKAHERSGRGSLALCSCTKAACPHTAAHRRAHAPATPRGPASWRAELCEWVDFQMNMLWCSTRAKPTELRVCLVGELKIFGCHIGCVGRGFWILIKKQITEHIRKLRDESNDTN